MTDLYIYVYKKSAYKLTYMYKSKVEDYENN